MPAEQKTMEAVETFTSIVCDAINEFTDLRIKEHKIESGIVSSEVTNLLEVIIIATFDKTLGGSLLALATGLAIESNSFNNRCKEFLVEKTKNGGKL